MQGTQFRKLRENARLTRKQLAPLIGTTYAYIVGWENKTLPIPEHFVPRALEAFQQATAQQDQKLREEKAHDQYIQNLINAHFPAPEYPLLGTLLASIPAESHIQTPLGIDLSIPSTDPALYTLITQFLDREVDLPARLAIQPETTNDHTVVLIRALLNPIRGYRRSNLLAEMSAIIAEPPWLSQAQTFRDRHPQWATLATNGDLTQLDSQCRTWRGDSLIDLVLDFLGWESTFHLDPNPSHGPLLLCWFTPPQHVIISTVIKT